MTPTHNLSTADAVRMARLEFDALCRDLSDMDGDLQEHDANATSTAWVPVRPQPIMTDGLPVLPVPVGRIAVPPSTGDLPVIGIAVATVPSEQLRSALFLLFAEHHRSAIARLLFLLDSSRLAPLLGRYGFAYHLGPHPLPETDLSYLSRRHGLLEVRALSDGQSLWRRSNTNES